MTRGSARAAAIVLLGLLLLLVAGFGAASGSGGDQPPGEVGDPPTSDLPARFRCFKELKPCSDPVIIAAGAHPSGVVELIGFQWKHGFCFERDMFAKDYSSGSIGCSEGSPLPSRGAAVVVTGAGGTSSRSERTTDISGFVRPDVAAVRIRYRLRGRTRPAGVIFNQVDGDLLQLVGGSEPFGVFETTVNGCVEPNRFRVVAYGIDGAMLGTDRLGRTPFGFCDPLPVGPGTEGRRLFSPAASPARTWWRAR